MYCGPTVNIWIDIYGLDPNDGGGQYDQYDSGGDNIYIFLIIFKEMF